ncbi:hypothetical protein C8R45DRAFT_766751, partial [Mycena sanguinolenta]
ERSYCQTAADLAVHIYVPNIPDLLDQLSSDCYLNEEASDDDLDISEYTLSVYHSAVATFYAPSDPSGICGMQREHIRSTPAWRKHGP